MNLPEIRAKYPQYNNLTDADLATKLHQKFYPQLAFDDFAGRIGYTPQPAQPEPTAIDRALDTIANSGRLWTPSEQAGVPPPIPDEIAGLPQVVFPKPSLPSSLPSMATAEPITPREPEIQDQLSSSHLPTMPTVPAHAPTIKPDPTAVLPDWMRAVLRLYSESLQGTGDVAEAMAGTMREAQRLTPVLEGRLDRALSQDQSLQAAREKLLSRAEFGRPEFAPLQPPTDQRADLLRQGLEASGQTAQTLSSYAKNLPEIKPVYAEGSVARLLEDAGAGMARFAPVMGLSVAAPEVALPATYMQVRGNSYRQKAKRGVDDQTAWDAAGIEAAISAPMEFGGNIFQLKLVGQSFDAFAKATRLSEKAGQVLRNIVFGGLGEGAEEYFQAYPEELGEIYANNPKASADEITKKAVEWYTSREFQKQAGYSALAGGIGGAALGGLGAAGGALSRRHEQDVQAQHESMEQEASRLRERAAASVNNILDGLREDAKWRRPETPPEPPGEAPAAGTAETLGTQYGPQAEAPAPPPVKFANAPRGTAADLTRMPLADLDKVPMEQRVKLLFPDLSDAEAKQVADSVQANVAEGIANAEALRENQGSSDVGKGLVRGQGPGAGGEDLQRHQEARGAPALIEPLTTATMQQAVDSDQRLSGMVRVDAVGEEGTTLPPGMVQVTVIGEHPASGGSFSVDADTNAIAQRLDQEAQRWKRAPEAQPQPIPGGGNGDRIKSAYDALKAERGVENIEIADIRDRAGVTQAEIEAYLRRQGEAGKAVTTTGDLSVADDHTRSGAIRLSNPERPDLLARIDEREPAQVQLAETQTEPEAKAEHVETAQDIIKTLIDRGFKRIESYGVYSRQLLGRPELTRDEFYKIYDEYAAEFGGKERPARPAEPKPEPEPAPAPEPKPDVKAAGQVERLRATANRIKQAANEKFSAQRNENTPRRARMAEGARNEAASRIAQAETMLRIADGIEAGELKALRGVRAATHVETLDNMLRRADGDPAKARMPEISVGEGVVNSLRKDLGEHRGGKALLQDMGYGRFFDFEMAKRILDFAKKNKITSVVWQLENGYNQNMRLREMGITNADELRQAMQEYAGVKQGKRKEDPIKKMEAEVRFRKIPGFFPTPKPVREIMLEKAGIEEGMKVLEPSAGKGDIADDIRAAGVMPDVIEINPDLVNILNAKGYTVANRDFMELAKETTKTYDRIVMNPPFERGQDMDHVMEAFKLLKPGGRLVSVMSPGPFFRSDKKAHEFRQWFGENEGEVEDLPAGSFKGVEAFRETGVAAKLVTIDKPKAKAKPAEPAPPKETAPAPEAEPEPEPAAPAETKPEAKQASKIFEHWETKKGTIAAVDKGPYDNWTFYIKPKDLSRRGTRIRGKGEKLFFKTRDGALIALQEYAAGRGWKPVGEGMPPTGKAEGGEAEIEKVVSDPTAGKLKPAEQKKWLVEEIETAIKEAPGGVGGWITFQVPNDGEFTVKNSKIDLREFKKLTEKQWPTAPGPKPNFFAKPSTKPGKKRVKGFPGWYYNPFKARESGLVEEPASGKKSGKPGQYYNGGFFSNGMYAVAVGEKPKLKHPVATATEVAEGDETTWQAPDLKQFMEERAAEKGWKPAEIMAEFYSGTEFDSKLPDFVYVHFKTSAGDDIVVRDEFVDSILTLHPKAMPFANKEGRGILFKDGNKVVGLAMGINLDNSIGFDSEIEKHFKPRPTEEEAAADQSAQDVAEMIKKTKEEIEQAKNNLEKAEPLRARGAAGESIYQEQKRNLEMLESRLRDFEKMRDENFGAPSGTASKGLYATERISEPDLGQIEVSVKYQTEDGRTAVVKQSAAEALKEIDAQSERMKALEKCLEG